MEEDLRAASAFLSTKRSSSVFTDSLDDLSSRCDDYGDDDYGDDDDGDDGDGDDGDDQILSPYLLWGEG